MPTATMPSLGRIPYNAGGNPRTLMTGTERANVYYFGISKDTSLGYPEVPSIQIKNGGFVNARWKFSAGQRTLRCKVRATNMDNPYKPRIYGRPSEEYGVAGTYVEASGAENEWLDLQVTINPTAAGAVDIELGSRFGTEHSQCNFDFFTWS
jgi:hypothetical protein